MTIEEFKNKFVHNDRRTLLFNQLLDEILYMKEFTTNLKIGVFGSFITDKDYPGDVDIIICGNLNKKGIDLQMEFYPKQIPIRNIDVQRLGSFGMGNICESLLKIIEKKIFLSKNI